tara:strand:- start:761 stop:1750 length:990 start_codon:yes stop_codon:yes gene_type:complete
MDEKFDFNFELQDYALKIDYSCSKNTGPCKITLLDSVYKCILYSYEIELVENVNYFFYPPTACVFACSKFLTFKIENEKNESVFLKDFKISKNIDLACLDKFPDIIKYKNQNLFLFMVCEIFFLSAYEKLNFSIKKEDIVVDVGGNFGLFTYFACYKKPSKIYVCEPNPNVFSILESHFLNYKNIHLDNCAVSKENGFADFALVDLETDYSAKGRNCLKSNCERVQLSEKDYKKTIKIKTKTFLEFILTNKIHKIDFLKVDCEGGEYDIFTEENASYIRNNVDKIVVEYHNYANQIVDFAIKNDFIILNEIKDTNCDVLFLKNKNEPRK